MQVLSRLSAGVGSQPRRRLSAISALLLAGLATPCAAERLQQLGQHGADKVYLDLDSIKMVEGLKVLNIVNIYAEPRVNNNGLLLDRHMEVVALDCAGRRAVVLRTVGFLNGKHAGSSPETAGWRDHLAPLGANEVNDKAFSLVCNAATPGPQAAETTPSPAPGPAPAPWAPVPVAPSGAKANQYKLSTGSGIFVDPEGYILTNAHVANGCKYVFAKVPNQQPVPATLEAVDPKNDLALVRARPGYGVPAAFRNKSKPGRLGESIGVIGYPLAGLLSTEPKATFGQINSVAGLNNDYTLLQISAPVQPGNSGGPVLDDAGLVVGVVVSEISPTVASRIGVPPQNVNFAIRGELAQIFMTAHGVPFASSGSHHHLETDEVAANGARATAQLMCLKQP